MDSNNKAVDIININLEKTKNKENANVFCFYADEYLKKAQMDGKKFNLIFLDPPYRYNTKDIIKKLVDYNLLDEVALIVYETDNENYINELKEIYSSEEGLELFKVSEYGRVKIAFLA